MNRRLGGPYGTVAHVPTYRLPHHVHGGPVGLCTFCYDLYVEYDEDLASRWQQQERNEPQFGELCCSCGRPDQPSKEEVLTQAQVTLLLAAVNGGATRSELLRVALNAWWQARHEAPPTVPAGRRRWCMECVLRNLVAGVRLRVASWLDG